MITANVQYLKGFNPRFSEACESVEAFGTVTVKTSAGDAVVFYDDKTQIRAHIHALNELYRQFDQQQTK